MGEDRLKGVFGRLRRGNAVSQDAEELIKRLRRRVRKTERELEESRVASSPPIFFLVGQAKSGTSWLMRTINSHPEVLCRGEGRIFGRAYKREDVMNMDSKTLQPSSLYRAILDAEYLDAWVERSVWTRDHDKDGELRRVTGAVVRAVLLARLAESGKSIVGDKTPFLDEGTVGEVAAMVPEAKVLHIVRDGRDVAVSWMHHLRKNRVDLVDGMNLREEEVAADPSAGDRLFTDARIRTVAESWARHVVRASEDGPRLFGENYAEVRYEDLLERPEEGFGRVFGFLGAAADPETVARCVERASFERWSKGRRRGEEDPGSLLRKGVAGDWKSVFTDRDEEIFEEVAGCALARLGYKSFRQ